MFVKHILFKWSQRSGGIYWHMWTKHMCERTRHCATHRDLLCGSLQHIHKHKDRTEGSCSQYGENKRKQHTDRTTSTCLRREQLFTRGKHMLRTHTPAELQLYNSFKAFTSDHLMNKVNICSTSFTRGDIKL